MKKRKETVEMNGRFPKEFSKKERIFYLAGMLGQNMIINLVTAAISVFYTDVLLIDTVILGFIMMGAQIWDAVNDPIMGMIVDKTHTKRGKCVPYLLFVPLPIFLLTVALFAPVAGLPMGARIAYATITYVIWTMVYTIGDIPLWTICSLVTKDERKRTSLISAARVIGSLAIIITLVFFDIKNVFGGLDIGLFPDTGKANYDGYFSEQQGYLITAILIAFIGCALFQLVGPNVKERVTETEAGEKATIKENLKTMFKNKPFVRIVISGIIGSTRFIVTVAGVYYCKWVLGNGNDGMWFALVGGAFMVGMLVSMGICPWLSRKFGKKNIYIWTSYLGAVPYLVLFGLGFLVGLKNIPLLMISIFLGGFLSGFTMVLQTAMVADSVDYMEYKTNKRNDAIYFSGMTFISKLSNGITILITNLLLGSVNYTETINKINEGIANNTITNLDFTAEYKGISNVLFALITVVPAIGSILQAIPMHGYEFNDKQYEEFMVELNARREAENKAKDSENNAEVN